MLGRRVIFGILAIGVIGVMLLRTGLPISVSPTTQNVFEIIDALDSGSVVMMSFDHEASSLPEVGPLAAAVADHCFRKSIHVVGLALFSEGTAAGYDLLGKRAAQFGRVYGSDWIYLGFRPQYTAAILGMGESIPEVFAADYGETPLTSLPLGAHLGSYEDIDLVVSVADGSMPTYWVEYAQARYSQRVVAALSAVMVTSFLPYLEAGQLDGIIAGFRGAAEYEQLLKAPDAGTRGMSAQSAAHAVIAILIIVGNIEAWRSRRKRGSA